MKSTVQSFLCLCTLFFFHLSAALKFDIQAHPGSESEKKERCIRNFVARDTLVVVTVTVDGTKGDGQILNMHVCLSVERNAVLARLGSLNADTNPNRSKML